MTKFISGDDLEDDFVTADFASTENDASDAKDAKIKSKKKQGPKVVNFVG